MEELFARKEFDEVDYQENDPAGKAKAIKILSTTKRFQSGFYNTTASNQVFINSFDRGSYALEQAGSPFYAQQNATVANQIVTLNGRVGINTISPNTSAALQVSSTTRGFLPPQMTTTQRDAITTPAAGLIIYNTTTNKHQGYDGTTWNDFY
jgi:hypothetical protein